MQRRAYIIIIDLCIKARVVQNFRGWYKNKVHLIAAPIKCFDIVRRLPLFYLLTSSQQQQQNKQFFCDFFFLLKMFKQIFAVLVLTALTAVFAAPQAPGAEKYDPVK